MTGAQINFHNYVEQKRHNLASEALSQYATDTQAETQRYVANTNATTQRYVSDQSARTSLATAQIHAEASKYAADKSYEMNQQRLAFDKEMQAVKNALEQERNRLQGISTEAEAELKRAQAQKVANDISVSLESLAQAAERLGMDEEAQKFKNLETQAKTVESKTKSAKNVLDGIKGIFDIMNAWPNK